MKRWIGLLLVFALCVGMIACAAAEAPPEEPVGEPLSEEEMQDIAALAEKLAPVDYFAKSFVSEDLTDGELLFLAYSIFGAAEYGIVGVDSEWFTDYAQKYFGRAVTEVGDILCSCGAVCAYYDGAGHYDWEGRFHDYTAHSAVAYNEYIDAYKLDGRYVLRTYKTFPDLPANTDPNGAIRFYDTYADAAAQENVLFTAADEDAFAEGLQTLQPEDRTVYTYTFRLSDDGKSYFLESYAIGE